MSFVAPKQRPPRKLYKAKRSVGVSARTHTRVLRLRERLGLRTMGEVVDLVTRGVSGEAPALPAAASGSQGRGERSRSGKSKDNASGVKS